MVNPLFLVTYLSLLTQSKEFSVSGISSGAFMAVQMGVAFSKDIVGLGAIAGGPYYCALGSVI